MFKRIAIPALVLIVITGFAWYIKDFFTTQGYAPFIAVEYLEPTDIDTVLFLKDRDQASGGLRMKASNRPEVLLYDPSNKVITKVGSKEWELSTEKEVACAEPEDPENYLVRAHGTYILGIKSDPEKKKLAVLSAYGPQTPGFSVFPGLGGTGMIWGTRYLEIKRFPGFESVGKPFRINIPNSVNDPYFCWSDKSRFLVVHHESSNISVVDNFANSE